VDEGLADRWLRARQAFTLEFTHEQHSGDWEQAEREVEASLYKMP
jgi:hypothetical protein